MIFAFGRCFSAHEVSDAAIEEDQAKQQVAVVFGVVIAFCSLISLAFIYLTVRSIDGSRRIFVVLQQSFLLAHQIFVALPFLVPNRQFTYALGNMEKYFGTYQKALSHRIVLLPDTFKIFEDFFHYEYYLVSMMQSVVIYKMVTDPFKYKEFNELGNIVRYLLRGTLGCLLMSLDSLAILLVRPWYLYRFVMESTSDHSKKILTGLLILKLVKTILFKIFSSIAIIRIAILTKNNLSTDMGQDNRKKELRQRLYYFMLIPLFLNVLYLGQEVMEWLDVWKTNVSGGRRELPFLKMIMLSISSLAYFFGFFFVSPKVREAFTCSTSVQS